MKKILIIAAAVLCAVVSQAAQVSWSATAVNKNGTNLATGTMTGYLFDTATVTIAQAEEALANGTFDSLISKSISNPGTSSVTAGAVSGTAKTLSSEDYPGGKSVTAFAVIFDNADSAKAENYIITNTKTASIKGSGVTSFSLGSQASNNTWTAVPEPTTVALLALGLAALGLKRKVA